MFVHHSLLVCFFSFSDSESDDELDESELDDRDVELDSFERDRFLANFSFTGDATDFLTLLLLFDDVFFVGDGDGDRRFDTGSVSFFTGRFAGDFSLSSSEDDDDGLTLIRFARFFSRDSSGDRSNFFRAALTGEGDCDGERDDDELDDDARAFPLFSIGFFLFLSMDDADDDDDDDDDGDRFFTGSTFFTLTGLRRCSGVGERRRFDVGAFDLS